MPFTKEALSTAYNLSQEDVDATLLACGLPLDQPEYTDEDIQKNFEKIRLYLNEGQAANYESARDLLKQELAAESNGKRKKSSKAKTKHTQEGEETALSREQILLQIQSLMERAGGLSGEEFAQMLPELAHQRQAELIEMFDRGLLARLSEMTTSGELEEMVRQSAGKKSLPAIPSLFLEAEVIEEPSSPPLLSES